MCNIAIETLLVNHRGPFVRLPYANCSFAVILVPAQVAYLEAKNKISKSPKSVVTSFSLDEIGLFVLPEF